MSRLQGGHQTALKSSNTRRPSEAASTKASSALISTTCPVSSTGSGGGVVARN